MTCAETDYDTRGNCYGEVRGYILRVNKRIVETSGHESDAVKGDVVQFCTSHAYLAAKAGEISQ